MFHATATPVTMDIANFISHHGPLLSESLVPSLSTVADTKVKTVVAAIAIILV